MGSCHSRRCHLRKPTHVKTPSTGPGCRAAPPRVSPQLTLLVSRDGPRAWRPGRRAARPGNGFRVPRWSPAGGWALGMSRLLPGGVSPLSQRPAVLLHPRLHPSSAQAWAAFVREGPGGLSPGPGAEHYPSHPTLLRRTSWGWQHTWGPGRLHPGARLPPGQDAS